MAFSTKKKWTHQQWIEFGNRVKDVRAELQSMITDVQGVCKAKELDKLIRLVRQLDKWKSSMENELPRDIPSPILTRIFYGDKITEAEYKRAIS